MEFLLATGIGGMAAAGIYLMLRARTFPVILGLTLLSYAVNLFLVTMGRMAVHEPPIIRDGVSEYTDPLPHALVLTAIVIGFAMTAFIIVLAIRARWDLGSDHVDGKE